MENIPLIHPILFKGKFIRNMCDKAILFNTVISLKGEIIKEL